MSKSVREMAKQKGVREKTVRRWIESGYWPGSLRDEKGEYVLPDDLPAPYTSYFCVERDSDLLLCLLDAADLGQIVYPNIFPNFSDERFDRVLSYAEEQHLVERRTPYPGIIQLISTTEGRAMIGEAKKEHKNVFDVSFFQHLLYKWLGL